MYKTVRISDFLHRRKDTVNLDPNVEYNLVTVKLYHKGVVIREKKTGGLINSNMYRISKGQFILSGIEYSGGNYTGVVPPDPISNSEVKYSKADGSALRESR